MIDPAPRLREGFARHGAASGCHTPGTAPGAVQRCSFQTSRWEDVFHSWEQLLRARHLGDVVEVQARYAQRAYDAYMSEMSKLGEM